jgi:flagellar hook-associated protein 3 FlgL
VSVTRVSDLAQAQLLAAQLNRANTAMATTELQVSSGKKAQYFKELGDQTGVLLAAKGSLQRNTQYTQTITQLQQRLDTQAQNLSQIDQATSDLRQHIMNALANGSGEVLMDQLSAAFQTTVGALNTEVNGQYIFGGTRTDAQPVTVTSLAALGAAPSAASVFQNSQTTQSAVVDDGVKINYGFLASDVGTKLMDVMRDIQNAGPFGSTLTTSQEQFLKNELVKLKDAASDVTLANARNGVLQNQADAVSKQLSNEQTTTKQFVSDIEDADLPTALSQLQQDQFALQAASHVAAQIGQLSLLNYLPIG